MFKNLAILDENQREENLFDISKILDKFKTKIENIKSTAIVWLIAPFWYGKTTFINQFNEALFQDAHLINFEAWKYPNRDNLRESLVIETARSIDQDEVKKVIKKIDWKANDAKTLLSVVSEIPLLSSIKYFNHFLETSPAKRTFEVQTVFSYLLNKITQESIYIVVEDIDRSGDAWIYFLETVSHFFKNEYISKRVIVIVSIWSKQWSDNLDSYLKTIDYSRNLSYVDLKCNIFVDRIFNEAVFEWKKHLKGQIITFLEWFLKEFPWTTIRLLKKWLRQSISTYEYLNLKYWDVIDFRLCMVFEFAKLVKDDRWVLYYEKWLSEKRVGKSDSIFSALISCIIQENHRIKWQLYDSIYVDNNRSSGIVRELRIVEWAPIKMVDFDYLEDHPKDAVLYFTNYVSVGEYYGIPNLYIQ